MTLQSKVNGNEQVINTYTIDFEKEYLALKFPGADLKSIRYFNNLPRLQWIRLSDVSPELFIDVWKIIENQKDVFVEDDCFRIGY